MSARDSNGDAEGADAQLTPIHVTAVLVASARAMSNALDALGFPEEDNRIVEQDGRFGFVTCSHEDDCDDMFALIAELSSSGETWEIQFQADLAPGRVLSHTLSRHRSIVAHEQVLPHSDDEAVSKMSIVAPAERSPAARHKAAARRTEDDLPLHSFRSLLRDLATLVLNKATVPSNPNYTFNLLTKPTPLQARAFELLAVSPAL